MSNQHPEQPQSQKQALIQSLPLAKTLGDLKDAPAHVACAHCPKSLWHRTSLLTSCYCGVMGSITWQTGAMKASEVIICDCPLQPQDGQSE